MERLALHRPLASFPPSPTLVQRSPLRRKLKVSSDVSFAPIRCQSSNIAEVAPKPEYKPGIIDDWFLGIFRRKMVEEVGWDSEKPGYDGLMEVVNHLMTKGQRDTEIEEAAVRILVSLFPSWLLELFKLLVSPIAGGKVAATMVARVTAITCQWLMGKCTVNAIELSNGSSWKSGVFVEKCKYLEESKCIGICINTCKLPTQTFFKDQMGVPLTMEPNFSDFSCQFKFGVLPPPPEKDTVFQEPCLQICPNATRRRELRRNDETTRCPKI
ncbi:beta-carotene isomerase D27, chloroplastic [Aristolochia californica]|uniref:beta-carotene isomerase D27, chloroplastic n=1 Tax=Aristolochia californica TaxID=171875 RepID=UPI0035DD4259